MECLNINKLLHQFLDWKITFIAHCGNVLLIDLYKYFLKIIENFAKNGRTINNSLLGAVGTICLGSYNFVQKHFDTLINYINNFAITFENNSQVFYFYVKFSILEQILKKTELKRVN